MSAYSKSLLLGFGALAAVMVLAYWNLWSRCLATTDGNFTYAIDDAYIHLSIAKNLALHGVWGVTAYSNASACSSPLWVCLLAGIIRICGANDLLPLGLNLGCGFCVAFLIYERMLARGVFFLWACLSALLVFWGTSLLVLPFGGMEHCLQVLLVLAFGFWYVNVGIAKCKKNDLLVAFALSFAMTLCRYESFALVLVPVVVSIFRRDFRLASALVLGPVTAIAGFGAVSLASGMPFLPNSIVLKAGIAHGQAESFRHLAWLRTSAVLRWPPLYLLGSLWWALLASFAFVGWASRRAGAENLQAWLVSLAACILIQSNVSTAVVASDWASRYEASLVASVSTFCLYAVLTSKLKTSFRGLIAQCATGLLCILLIASTLVLHAIPDLAGAPKACSDIYSQQRQMSKFVERCYKHGRVAANDIGCITFYTDSRLLDLVGLADNEMCRLRLSGRLTTATLGSALSAFRPDVIIAYPSWFTGTTSFPSWVVPVAKWDIGPTTSAGSGIVEFYAMNSRGASNLRRQLFDFSPSLPPRVAVEYVEGRGARRPAQVQGSGQPLDGRWGRAHSALKRSARAGGPVACIFMSSNESRSQRPRQLGSDSH